MNQLALHCPTLQRSIDPSTIYEHTNLAFSERNGNVIGRTEIRSNIHIDRLYYSIQYNMATTITRVGA
jgi:hypothetical protein